ncbi:MAG: TIGR03986 family type III CRISPR-associated RAMP protein [Egibacteraceae bacterium]
MEHLPHHVNPPDGRTATAPYNFVPLPQQVLLAERVVTGEPWKAHDRWLPGTHSGWIDLQIETLTPLFVRGPVLRQEGGWDKREARLRPEPWTTADGRPAIPGSSLRGMLRTLVEILAFATITPVSDAKPFFRTVSADRLGIAYRNRVLQNGKSKPEGGFLRRRGEGWVVEPAMVLRVPHRKHAQGFGYRQHPSYHPDWALQHQQCWVQRDGERVTAIEIGAKRPKGDGWAEGTLVLTGSAPNKEAEFVFLANRAAKPAEVPDEVWERFHDDDQISQWQEKGFPEHEPAGGRRRAAGHLRDGEPVFFLRESADQVRFLGRAQMFRFPYDRSMADLVPPALRGAELDVAEAVFGRVRKDRNDPLPTVKGRVFVEDAVGVSHRRGWFEPDLVPQILSSPKPTTFPHYLTQDGRQPKEALTTYLAGDETTIRGHKLYWHRWGEDELADVCDRSQSPRSSQHTVIRPVRAGVTFEGRVRFENLSDVELGALLAALRLPSGCAHKLGMAKPLGLGSVRITPALHLVDRAARYRSWSDTGQRPDQDAAVEAHCVDAFVAAVLAHAGTSQEATLEEQEGLRRVARLDALFTMLSWEEHPPREATAYMPLAGFKDRKVLPTPHRVSDPKRDEPDWPGPAPTAAPEEPDPDRPPAAATAVGSVVQGTALEAKTNKGGWVFALPDGQEGIFAPGCPQPSDLAPGRQYNFVRKTDPPRSERAQLWWVDPDAPPPAPRARPDRRRR